MKFACWSCVCAWVYRIPPTVQRRASSELNTGVNDDDDY